MNFKNTIETQKKIEKQRYRSPILACIHCLSQTLILAIIFLCCYDEKYSFEQINTYLINVDLVMIGLSVSVFFATIFFLLKFLKKTGENIENEYKNANFDDETIDNIKNIKLNAIKFYYVLFISNLILFFTSFFLNFFFDFKISNIFLLTYFCYSFFYCLKLLIDYFKVLKSNLKI